jgi:hypothetical protein
MEFRPTESCRRAVQSNVGEATEDGEKGLALHGMKLDIADEDLDLITKALDHYPCVHCRTER